MYFSLGPASTKYKNFGHGEKAMADDEAVRCDYCGNPLESCMCVCPYCGQKEACECCILDAATGGG